MKNKRFIFLALIIAILVIGYYIFSPTRQNEVVPEKQLTQEEIKLKSTTSEAAEKWGNFSDNTTDGYLDSIKPYLSEDLFEEQKEFSEAQKRLNEKAGKTLSQKFTVKKIELIERSEEGWLLTYKITGKREFGDGSENVAKESITYIKYEQIDGEWKIISIESD